MNTAGIPENSHSKRAVRIPTQGLDLSGVWMEPKRPVATLVLAHGAGAGMDHPHLERLAQLLADDAVATLRYQFPYMERGSGRPDRAPVLEQAVRDAVATATELAGGTPLFAGGRSMGARMSARAHAGSALPVRGLVFFAFPLHRPLRVADPDPARLERATHLFEIAAPMLFLAGSRDRLARPHLLQSVVEHIGTPPARLHMIDTADHSFVPTKKSGRQLSDVEREIAAACAQWMRQVS